MYGRVISMPEFIPNFDFIQIILNYFKITSHNQLSSCYNFSLTHSGLLITKENKRKMEQENNTVVDISRLFVDVFSPSFHAIHMKNKRRRNKNNLLQSESVL